MLTPTQKRAMRAQSLLDSGMDPREAARECGYKNVNGMMGAIALCLRKLPKEDQEAEMQRMQEEEHKCEQESIPELEPAPMLEVQRGEYVKPGIYDLPGKGEVLVGQKMTEESWQARRRMLREKAMERFNEHSNTVHTETKRVSCRYGKNDKTNQTEFRLHVFGVDKWIVLDEELVGGKEEMIRILREAITGINVVLEGIA